MISWGKSAGLTFIYKDLPLDHLLQTSYELLTEILKDYHKLDLDHLFSIRQG
jgi:hypothetical protein